MCVCVCEDKLSDKSYLKKRTTVNRSHKLSNTYHDFFNNHIFPLKKSNYLSFIQLNLLSNFVVNYDGILELGTSSRMVAESALVHKPAMKAAL